MAQRNRKGVTLAWAGDLGRGAGVKTIWVLSAVIVAISLIWLVRSAGAAASPGSAFLSIIDSASTAQGNGNPLLAAVAGEAFSFYDRSLAEASVVSLVLVGFVMSWGVFALPWLDED
jgi:hypothetical protein